MSREIASERPKFLHPAFDHESRIVTASVGELTVASVYVPNGGKDFAAKMKFLAEIETYASTFGGARELVRWGDINVTRADIDVHPKERKPNTIGQRPEERAMLERILARGLARRSRRGRRPASRYARSAPAITRLSSPRSTDAPPTQKATARTPRRVAFGPGSTRSQRPGG